VENQGKWWRAWMHFQAGHELPDTGGITATAFKSTRMRLSWGRSSMHYDDLPQPKPEGKK
jgi:hypothetical protein